MEKTFFMAFKKCQLIQGSKLELLYIIVSIIRWVQLRLNSPV